MSQETNHNHRSIMNSETLQLINLMQSGYSPRDLLSQLAPSFAVPIDANDMSLWRLIFSMIEPPKRTKLTQYNTIDDVINLIKTSRQILVLSGAGISTSAGLPDFRSRNGIYVQINREHPDLHDPKMMFDIDYFRTNPKPFFHFAKALYPGQYKPTVGHMFIKCLEDHNKLLRNYTQNIDTLERQAGIKRAVECHGSFARATCTSCSYSVDCDVIRQDILTQEVPKCPKCHSSDDGPADGLGVMKPNIVFFGEQLGEEFHSSLDQDKEEVDLLIVIGSSLKVRPVALIPRSIPAHVPQILINREPLDHMSFDVELLGDCDGIIEELGRRLGETWNISDRADGRALDEIRGRPALKILTSSLDVHSASSGTCDKEEASNTHEISNEEILRTVEPSVQDPVAVNKKEKEVDESPGARCAISEKREEDNDDEWEDLQVVESDSETLELELDDKLDLNIPSSAYLFISPSKYMFPGVELTRAQITELTRDEIN